MKYSLAYIILLTLFLGSCTGLRYISKEETLYAGAKIEVVNKRVVRDQSKVVSQVKDIVRPKPNTSILGSRPFLWVYFAVGTPKKEKGLRSWLKTNIGQAPVMMSMVDPILVSQAIDAKLYNMGFFTAYSQADILTGKSGKTTSITYKLFLDEPYRYQEIVYPRDSDDLSKHIAATQRRSSLKPDDRYDLDMLMLERERIDNRLKRQGFYYFNPEYILFKTDSSLGNRKLRLFLTVKREAPPKARMIYKISDVNVYPDYTPGRDSLAGRKEVIDTINYFHGTDYVRPEPVIRAIFIKNNTVYDRNKHTLTLGRLNNLGIFRFVNVRIKEKDTLYGGWLTADIFLSPMPKKTISVEMQAVSKSNNFVGPALTFSLRNRNSFKGAELMIYNLRGSFETQFNGLYKGKYTYEINPRVELYVPRFMVPFKLKTNSRFVPRTKYIIDYSFLSRVGYFDLNSLKLTYGYKWKQTITIDHDLSVVNINYFDISNPSDNFTSLINSSLVLRRRFEEQFITSSSYSFFYNGQVRSRKKNQFYFNGNAEAAGNSLALFKKAVADKESGASGPAKIFGINFAQFVRMDIDVRDYVHLSENNMIASRFIAGWGIPYGNSITMPYIRQFFSGGAYSVRGFQAYSIGPGSYAPPDSARSLYFLQQGGEIKLEMNLEYRFPLVGVLKGALFADAGNVWLNKENPEIPGGAFKKEFLQDLAVGIGTGLRVDLNFFVLRFDLGVPARKPWLPNGQRWILHTFDLGSPTWRRENLVFNVAFGYPF